MASFFLELRRRNVFKVAAAYAIVSWLLIQIVVSIEAPLNLPPWSDTLVIVLLAVGFVIALFFAWAYELTPDGVKQTKSLPLSERVTGLGGRRLDFTIIGSFVLPGEDISAEGFASALLVDVRNGYPYGTARKVIKRQTSTPSYGSTEEQRKMMRGAESRAAIALVAEVDEMMRKLRAEMKQKLAAK